jgi:hypothetical protein
MDIHGQLSGSEIIHSLDAGTTRLMTGTLLGIKLGDGLVQAYSFGQAVNRAAVHLLIGILAG